MKVRLIPSFSSMISRAFAYFNSMKVRLILTERIVESQDSLFQFHEGSINTRGFIPAVPAKVGFQFHEGSINTLCYLEAEQ